MSTGDSFETRFEKIDNLLRDPKSEVNSDCLLVSSPVLWCLSESVFISFLLLSVWLSAIEGFRCTSSWKTPEPGVFPEESWSPSTISCPGPVYHWTGSEFPEFLVLTQFIITQKIFIKLCCRHHIKSYHVKVTTVRSLLNRELSYELSDRFDSEVGKDCFPFPSA